MTDKILCIATFDMGEDKEADPDDTLCVLGILGSN